MRARRTLSCFGMPVLPPEQRMPKSCERVGEQFPSIMKATNLKSGLVASAIVIGCATTTWLGCTKEHGSVAPSTSADPDISQGDLRAAPGDIFFSYQGATSPFLLTVLDGCVGTYGECRQDEFFGDDCPGKPIYIISQTTTEIGITGSCPTSTTTCIFTKPSAPGITGPTYYLIPNQGGSSPATRMKLRLRFKYAPFVPLPASGCGWFTYHVGSNTWTHASDASTYFVWTPVTDLPLPC
jgi:hypothetical protein